MPLTRRELLEMAALLAVAAPRPAHGRLRLSKGAPAAVQHSGDAASLGAIAHRAGETIRAYSAEGDHRTATAIDRASADALLARARATGASAALDGEAALRKMREGSRHAAIVAVTMGAKPGLCPVNAAWFGEPFGPPVLQVSSQHLAAFEAAMSSSGEVRVVAHATRQRAQAFNVVSEIGGADPALAPVCVMTPRSGWHANASERGGGVACCLETMRAVVAARGPAKAGRHVRGPAKAGRHVRGPAEAGRHVRSEDESARGEGERGLLRTVKFIASSGHELGHLGLHNYLTRNPALARDAYAWVHLGANIGTSTGDTGMTPSDARLRDAALRAFAPHGLDTIRQSRAAQVGGEAATIDREGGRFISFIGRNDWFHNPGDRWPDAVDVQPVARFARAVADLTLALANTPA